MNMKGYIHMKSKKRYMNKTYGTLQNKVMMQLARIGPQTITEVQKGLNIDANNYMAVSTAIHSLEKQSAIMKTGDSFEFKGKTYPRYWLNAEGLRFAIEQGADLSVLRSTSLQLAYDDPLYMKSPSGSGYNDNDKMQMLKAFFDALAVLDQKERTALLNSQDYTETFGLQRINISLKEFSNEKTDTYFRAMKKYPKVKSIMQDKLAHIQKILDED